MLYSIIPALRSSPIFINVSKSYIDKYFNESTVKIKEFPADAVALTAKNERAGACFIVNGTVRVYALGGEERTLLNTLHSGDIFGIANLYAENEPFPSIVITASEAQIAFVGRDTFKGFVENDKTALKNYLSFLTKKIIYLNKKITTFTAGTAEKKLAIFISENLISSTLALPSSMCELSKTLGIGRASLYRAVDSLKLCGIIKEQNKNIFIINTQKLNEFLT